MQCPPEMQTEDPVQSSHDDIFFILMTTYSASSFPTTWPIIVFFFSASGSTHRIAVPLEEHASEHKWQVSTSNQDPSPPRLFLVPAMPSISIHSTHINCYERVIKTDKRGYRALGNMERVFINKWGIHWCSSTILTVQRQSFDIRRQHLYSEQNRIV